MKPGSGRRDGKAHDRIESLSTVDFDAYHSIAEETRHSYKEQRSKFFAIALGVDSEEGFHNERERIEREFHDATHHCWALRLLDGEQIQSRSSDGGEPHGTAGRPILDAIERASLLNSAVIVARTFGGIKLGKGGLARAFREAARQVLLEAPIRQTILYDRLEVVAPFDAVHIIYRILAPPAVVLIEEHHAEDSRIVLDVRRSKTREVAEQLRKNRLRVAAVESS